MSGIFYRYDKDGNFDGFLMEEFTPRTRDDINLIEISPEVHLSGMDDTLKLKDVTNLPSELVTIDNLEYYFDKESNVRDANIVDNNSLIMKQLAFNKIELMKNSMKNISLSEDNSVIMKQLASNKLELMQKNSIINKLTTQIATNKIDILKMKGGK
ncbi:MAG: hypothetical protein ACRC28_06245 [Clostridium sp.]|uniref:hypothetical protein n=1 Tax=Clostridia TaxID=186801 RepID=UPI003F3D0C62